MQTAKKIRGCCNKYQFSSLDWHLREQVKFIIKNHWNMKVYGRVINFNFIDSNDTRVNVRTQPSW